MDPNPIHTSIRNLRANLKKHLHGGTTLIARAGHYGPVRGFLVPVPAHDRWSPKAKRKALAAAKRSFLAALRAEAR